MLSTLFWKKVVVSSTSTGTETSGSTKGRFVRTSGESVAAASPCTATCSLLMASFLSLKVFNASCGSGLIWGLRRGRCRQDHAERLNLKSLQVAAVEQPHRR